MSNKVLILLGVLLMMVGAVLPRVPDQCFEFAEDEEAQQGNRMLMQVLGLVFQVSGGTILLIALVLLFFKRS